MFARQLSDLFQDPVVYKSNSIVLDKINLGDCCNHDCCCCSRPIAYKSVQISRKKVSYYISMFLVVICIKSNLQSNVFSLISINFRYEKSPKIGSFKAKFHGGRAMMEEKANGVRY